MSGSASERLKKLRNQKNEEESTRLSSNNSRSGERLRGMMSPMVDARERAYAGNKFGIDTLEEDLINLGTTISNVYNGWQTQEAMANTRASVEAMRGRLEQYSGYQKRFGGTDLTETYNAYQTVLDGWDDLTKEYNKYDSTEEFNKALEDAKIAQEQYEEMRKSDLGEVKRQLDSLQSYSDSVDEYEASIRSLNNRKSTFDYRTRGYAEASTVVNDLKEKEIEYREFLKSIGYTDTEELRKDLNEKTLYYNNAKRIQNLDTLENIKNDVNFQEYSDKGLALAEEKKDSWLDQTSKNVIAYYRTHPEVMEEFDNIDEKTGKKGIENAMKDNLEYKAAKYMTDEQFAIFNAYMGSEGEEKAYEYLKAIEEKLNYAHGTVIADNQETLFDKLTFAADAGLSQFAESTINLFNNDDYIPQTSMQFASGMVRDSLNNTGFDILGSSIGQIAYDSINTTANMAPSILTSIAVNAMAPGVGSAVGSIMVGTSAAGSAYTEMVNLGYNKDQARTYSTLVGGSEALMSYLLSGIGALGGKLTKNVVQKAVQGIDNAFLKFSLQFAMNGVSEGIEEGLQKIAEPFYENFVARYEKNKWSDIDWEQVAYESMLGMLTSWAIEGSSDAVSYTVDTAKNIGIGKTIKANENVSQMADLFDTMELQGLTPEESESYRLYGKYLENGDLDSLSNAKLGKLYSTSLNESIGEMRSKDATDLRKKNAASRIYSLSEMTREKTVDEKARLKRVDELKKGEETKVDGKSAKIEGIKTEDGSTIVLTSQGEKKTEDITFSSNDAEIFSYAENMGAEKGSLFLKHYDGVQNVDAYVKSFDMAYENGNVGIGSDYALKNKGVLTESQVADIYKSAVTIKANARQKAIDEITAKYSAKKIKKGKFDDSIIDYTGKNTDGNKVNWNTLTTKQRSAIRLAKAFSKATGVNIVFTKSKIENGKHIGENGSYDARTNTITLDVYAGRMDANTAVDAIIPTLSHEVTHWMKAKAPEMYAKLQEKVMNTLNLDEEMSLDDRIKMKKWEMERNHKDQKATDEDAIDELVARACEDMLTNSETAREFLNELSEKEKKTFMEKVEEVFNNLLEWVNNLLSQYKSESYEAEVLRKYEDKLKEAQKLWDETFAEAVKVNQALNEAGTTAETQINKTLETIGLHYDDETKSVAPQYSERTWTTSEYVVDREKAIENLSKALGVSKKKAGKYVDSINSVAKLIADDRARLDYDSNIDDNASVMKPNSDYKWSIDMSTLCAKRLLFTGTFDAIQKMLPNTALDSDDIVKIRKMMMDKGYQVACGICYVESTRREIGTITNEFIEKYKESQKTGKPITRTNSSGKVIDLKKTKDQMETTVDKSTDKFYAEEGYTPTLADLNTTDIDLVKRDHPLVYEAYLNFMNARGQSKPKLLETRAEYKGEIAKRYARKKNGDVNNSTITMNASGGLRLQSFSDFEIAHLIDMMQIVMDMSNVGLMSQAYTKVPEFAEVFGDTGVKINLSLIAKGDGIDANGNLIFDDVEGIDHKRAFELRDRFSKNVGTILVGKNDAHIIKAMADPRIDYIIPFHKSSWKESLYDALGLTGYADYTDTQHEKSIDPDRKISDFKPSEYWDFTKSGDENGKIYLEKCKADGRIPKFPQFAQYDGYWKLLIDFKMYDNDGVGSPQTSVMPEFDMEAANRILNDYEGGHRSFPVAKDIVNEFVDDYKKNNHKVQYSTRDNVVGEDGMLYQNVVEMDMPKTKNAIKNAKSMEAYIVKELLGKTIPVVDENGNEEIIEFAKEKERVKKDGAKNSHEVIGKMVRASDELQKKAIVNSYEITEKSSDPEFVDEHNHQWLDERGWVRRYCFVMEKNGDAIYPARLSIGRARDGRNILYYVRVEKNKGIAIDKNATSDYANGKNQQAVKIAKPSYAWMLSQDEGTVKKQYSDRDIDSWLYDLDLDDLFEMFRAKEYTQTKVKTTRRVDQVNKMLKQIGLEFTGTKQAAWTDERIEKYLSGGYYGSTNKNYAQAYITYMTPKQFLDLTMGGKITTVDMIKKESASYGQLDFKKLGDSSPIYLSIKEGKNWSRVIGHEGRHRMYLLGKAGFEKIPVLIFDEDTKYSKTPKAEMKLIAQRYNDTDLVSKARNATVNDVIPFSQGNKELIKEKFGARKEADIHYSDRDPDYIDSRTLLTNALETVAKNDAEKNLLADYRKNIDLIQIKESELSEIKAKIKELSFASGPRDTEKIEYWKGRAEKLQNSINWYDKRLLSLEANEHLKSVVARERNKARKLAYEKNREYTKQYMTSYKERLEKHAEIESITQKALVLNKWIKKNSKDNPIPEPFKPAVVQLLNSIDFSSKQKLGMIGTEETKGTDTKKDLNIAKALEQIHKMATKLDKMRLEAQNEDSFLNQLDFPPFFIEELEQLVEYTNNLSETMGEEYVLNKMSVDQLKNLNKIISTLKQVIQTANSSLSFADKVRISDVSEKFVEYTEALAQKKTENLATEFLEYDNATPYYVFKRMGPVGRMMFESLMDGQEKFAQLSDEIEEFAKKTFTPEEAKKWSEEILEFQILDTTKSTKENPQYKTLKMTVAHAMSIYALSNRKAAEGHLVGGGIRIKDFKDAKNGEKIRDSKGATLSKSELDMIVDSIADRNDRAKEVADALQKFMSTTCAKWGNEVTMRRWMIEQFTEDFYFPMETIANGTNFDKLGSAEESIYSLANSNFAKALTPNANNKLVIDNIFDVFAKHSVEMAKYNSFVLPTLDIIKILGYSRKQGTSLKSDGKTHDTISVATSLTDAFGDGGLKYIVNLIKDLNGSEKTPRGEAIAKKLMANYKIQAVGSNLRVALLQGTAYVKAALNLDTKYLLKALATSGKRGGEKALKYSGIALWKSKGHYDINIARSVASRIKQDQTLTDKIKEGSLYLAGLGDERTWGRIWNACEYWAEDHTGYQKGSEEFNKAVAKRFRDVIVSTQVVDSTLTRSQMMRSKSAMAQTLTAFMSEGTMTYNMLADAFFEWSLDARQKGKSYKSTIGKHGRKFVRTLGVWAFTNLLVSATASAIDAVRDDDDEEEMDEKYMEAFWENIADNMNPLGMLPILKDIKSAFEGFSPTRFDEQSFTTLYQAYRKWLKVFEGDGNVYKATYKTLQGVSQLSGLPIGNAVRDVVAMWNTTVGSVYPSLKVK